MVPGKAWAVRLLGIQPEIGHVAGKASERIICVSHPFGRMQGKNKQLVGGGTVRKRTLAARDALAGVLEQS